MLVKMKRTGFKGNSFPKAEMNQTGGDVGEDEEQGPQGGFFW